jgi:anti-sigma regulatory factor (Ser/Thr protein kinase)
MTATVELRLEGPMDHLRVAWQTGATLLESIPFREDPEGTRYNVLLAIQEMLTNVLRHGYGGAEDSPIHLRFDTGDRGISIEMRDRGPEFDPTRILPKPESEGPPHTEGGYGIMIARVVMDELSYRRDGDWNVLVMTKLSHAAAEATTSPVQD